MGTRMRSIKLIKNYDEQKSCICCCFYCLLRNEVQCIVIHSTDSSQTGDNISNILHDMNVVISDNKYIGSRICPLTNSSVADDLE